MNPEITILMPVHNGAAYLEEALASMCHQTFPDFEFLVIDDASTDHSAAVVTAFNDPRIRLVQSRARLKLSGALNLGLDEARGELIARMDADDISLPSRLAEQRRYLLDHPDVGLCGSWIRYLGHNHGKILERPVQHDQIRAFLLIDTPFAHPTVMFRRSWFNRDRLRFNGEFFPTEDFELWTRALEQFKGANIPRPLLQYRVHGSSLTGSDWSTMDEQALRIITRQLQHLGLAPLTGELKFHRQLCMGRLDMTRETLDQAEAWLLRLVDANHAKPHYDPAALQQVLSEVWYRACLHSAHLGFWVTTRYVKSPLAHGDRKVAGRSWFIKAAALKGKLR